MVDRAARQQLALLLRRYAAGRIDVEQLVDGLPPRSQADPVIEELSNAVVFLEEDYDGTDDPDRWSRGVTRRDVARWVLFLRSDEEYRWPAKKAGNWFALVAWVLAGYVLFLIPLAFVERGTALGSFSICGFSLLLFGGGLALYAVVIEPRIEKARARAHGGDLALWPFHDAEQFARVACRHPGGPPAIKGSPR